jgi:PAS domain S-box-containing protein
VVPTQTATYSSSEARARVLGVARGCSRMRWQLLRLEVELLVEGASGQVAGAAGWGASVVPSGDLDGRVLLEMLADAVIAADATNRIVYANPAAGALLGWDPGKLVGQPLTTIVPERLRAAHLAGFTRYLDTRQARLIGRPARVAALRADGTEVEVELTLNTFRPASSADLFIASLRDLSDRVEAERLGALTRYLAATTEVAVQLGITGEVASLADAAPMVLASIGTQLGWDAGSIWELDPDGEQLRCLEVWQAPGVETGEFLAATRGRRFSKDVGLPGRVWSGAETVWITDVARDLNFPRAPQAIRAGLRSAFGFPVLSGGEVLGVVEFFSLAIKPPDEDLVGAMTAVGRQIGQFIARKRAEATSRAQLRFLAEASVVLDASLEYETTLTQVARLCVPRLGDTCLVDLAEADGLRRVAIACVDPAKEATMGELRRRYPPDPARPNPAQRVMRTGVAELFEHMPDAMWADIAQDEQHYELLRSLGLRSGITVPVVARGRTLGAISLGAAEAGRDFGQDELALLEEVGRRAGLAIDNARLYSERATIAAKLQESLLPRQLPNISGLELAARYLAAGAVEVGGDFYDVFATGDGGWALVVGDVRGKGVDAAAVTGMVRSTLRAVALHEPRPSRVLSALNDVLVHEGDLELFCTTIYARVMPTGDHARLIVASGGHPLPLVLRVDGTVQAAGTPGMLLGAFPEVDCPEAALELGVGDALVIYTDGVTERRRGQVLLGEAGLAQVLTEHAGVDASQLADRIEQTVATFQPDPPRDDMAVLVARFIGTTHKPRDRPS